ncbi:uncharacterized protein [Lolium perenne]|uniref:uncharacterized protein isoform X1 n=1 Tax=Lolium perenne TaxID=4522 RepID=UPI0021F500A8|nr:uncharacterized protein LOC127298558 isoform X1 [Lolium perenne]
MGYEGLEPVALSMSQGSGPQSSEGSKSGLGEAGSNSGLGEAHPCEGSNSGLGETSPDFSGASFSLDDNEINAYNGILNLQAPDVTTVMAIVHGEGYWTDVAWYFQDSDFVTLLNFMNSLGPETVEDEDFLDFANVVSFANSLGKESDEEDDMVRVLLNVDDVSEEL